MSFIGSMFDPNKGAGFQAQGANIQQSVTPEQVAASQKQAQAGMGQQQNFVNALAGQNGIGNQSSVFNQQQGLANQLQDRANGGGPNPALAQLQQATGQNVSNQAALMASQRGTGANPGMLARQAAQQGANIQQQAVGQGATMQAQQQIAAQQALQQQQNMMGGLATQQVGQQAGALQNYNQLAQNQQQQMMHSQEAQNQANIAMQTNMNNANASIAGVNAKGSGDMFSGLLSGIGSAAMMLAHGGEVPRYATGGETQDGPSSYAGKYLSGFGSMGNPNMNAEFKGGQDAGAAVGKGMIAGGKALAGLLGGKSVDPNGIGSQFAGNAPTLGVSGLDQPKGQGSMLGMDSLGGGPLTAQQGADQMFGLGGFGAKTPAKPSPELYGPAFAKGGKVKNLKQGGKVPGEADVEGDSLKNDTVPAMLSPKEIVLPRSVTMSEDPAGNAAKFVAAVLAKQSVRKKR